MTPLRRVPLDSGIGHAVLRLSDNMRRETGYEPPTCPWEAYSDPVVQAGIKLGNRLDKFSIPLDEELAVVVDAYELISRTQSHLEAKDRKTERERRQAEANIRNATSGGR